MEKIIHKATDRLTNGKARSALAANAPEGAEPGSKKVLELLLWLLECLLVWRPGL